MSLPVIGIVVPTLDCFDPRSWSGLPHAMYRAFRRRDDVEALPIGPLQRPIRGPEAVHKGLAALARRRYRWEVEPRLLDAYRRQLEVRLPGAAPDAVLCLGAVALGSLPKGVPATYYTDSTLNLNTDYYPTFTGLSRRSRRLGDRLERANFARAEHVVAASDWAAADMVTTYGVPPERITVLPIGAQHECRFDADELAARVDGRMGATMRLLWMGAEWERKGGDIALAAAAELHRRGVPVRLELAGDVPDDAVRDLPYVQSHGFIDRRTRGALLEELFLTSFALLLPSRAENSSVVLADAASHALPSLTSDTGGMPTMVHDGVNGRRIPGGGTAGDYADVLEGWWRDPDGYRELSRTSRRRFEEELDWDVIVADLAKVVLAHPCR